jgi:SAM-dependent methyltransferase
MAILADGGTSVEMSPAEQLSAWNASYARGDNHMLYPKEEVVKFLNRYVRKRTSPTQFRDILPVRPGAQSLRGVDFGCGIGRLTLLLEEFGIQAWGIEVSNVSLELAGQLFDASGRPELKKRLVLNDGGMTPFEPGFFDVGVCAGVLDSMPFETARDVIRELDRIVSRVAYIDLISGDNDRFHREFAGEEKVEAEVERGTIQSYFNWAKVQALVAETRFQIRDARLVTEQSMLRRYRYGRYHVVLEKK